MMPREPIPTVVRKLAKELAEPTPMRRDSVSERFMKCGRNCLPLWVDQGDGGCCREHEGLT